MPRGFDLALDAACDEPRDQFADGFGLFHVDHVARAGDLNQLGAGNPGMVRLASASIGRGWEVGCEIRTVTADTLGPQMGSLRPL